MKCAAVDMENRENQIESIKKETGFDEMVIGCFLSNYMVPHVCPIATGGWCRDYVKCKCVEEGLMRKIKEQQAHNEAVSKEEKKTPWKTFLLIAVLVFVILCIIMLLKEMIELIILGPIKIDYTGVVMLLVLYAVISLLAAGWLVYYIVRMEEM